MGLLDLLSSETRGMMSISKILTSCNKRLMGMARTLRSWLISSMSQARRIRHSSDRLYQKKRYWKCTSRSRNANSQPLRKIHCSSKRSKARTRNIILAAWLKLRPRKVLRAIRIYLSRCRQGWRGATPIQTTTIKRETSFPSKAMTIREPFLKKDTFSKANQI